MTGSRDLTGGMSALVLWCLPTVALIAGLSLPLVRIWLWIPALLVMGIACLVNAARCGRIHCFITGPVFLIAALYAAISARHLAPLNPGLFLDVVLALTATAFLVEFILSKHHRNA